MAHLEGRVEGFDRRFDALDAKVDRLREELSGRIDALDAKVDRLREELCGRIDTQSGRIDAQSLRIDALDAKVDRLREELGGRMERHFQWTMGLMIAIWSTVVVAMVVQSA